MREQIFAWFRRERVFCAAAVCALGTMILVPPDVTYASYVDTKVLCLLFALMAVVAGFQRCGAFRWIAAALLQRSRNGRILSLILILMPFFCAMLITNDVTLLTFVPFTLLLLKQVRCEEKSIPILILQTIAANLGSMATPIGNPQNLFLYTKYNLAPGAFFSVMFPLTALSLLCLAASALPILPKSLPAPQVKEQIQEPKKLGFYGVLFCLCLLTVFRLLPYGILTVLVFLSIWGLDRKLLRTLDYTLLATFVCFFIVSGNLGRVPAVQDFLQMILQKNALLTAVAASQVISNVPAAVLLSEFTEAWSPLLQGVNIGGLGTPIASLASLITLKLYLAQPNAKAGTYLAWFMLANGIGLTLLLGAALL